MMTLHTTVEAKRYRSRHWKGQLQLCPTQTNAPYTPAKGRPAAQAHTDMEDKGDRNEKWPDSKIVNYRALLKQLV